MSDDGVANQNLFGSDWAEEVKHGFWAMTDIIPDALQLIGISQKELL